MPVSPKDLPNRDLMLAENPTLIDRFESKIEKSSFIQYTLSVSWALTGDMTR